MQYNLSNKYTREMFLDDFGPTDIEKLGLKFPEESEMREDLERYLLDDEADLDELKSEFYYQFFIQKLEMKLWDSPQAENTENELSHILSYWKDVV